MPSYPGIATTTRAELSEFLKSRRARIAPLTVGISNRSRRRTPGLRREEVADLTGVGPTWYTWLEQGRDIRVSAEVLTGIARVLQFEPAERAHLFRLAGHAPPAADPATAVSIPPRLQRVIDAWDPYPALITGRRRDVLTWNRSGDLINGYSRLPAEKRNILWWYFLVPWSRRLMLDWDREAALTVAAFRAEAGGELVEPDYQQLITELLDLSPDFAAIWARQDVRERQGGFKRLRHPKLGRLDLESTSLRDTENPSLRLFIYSPADRKSEDKLREAAAASLAKP